MHLDTHEHADQHFDACIAYESPLACCQITCTWGFVQTDHIFSYQTDYIFSYHFVGTSFSCFAGTGVLRLEPAGTELLSKSGKGPVRFPLGPQALAKLTGTIMSPFKQTTA